MQQDHPLSRIPNPERTAAELRIQCPLEVLAVIDACGDRSKVVNKWLRKEAERVMRRSVSVVNASRGNPSLMDSDGTATADPGRAMPDTYR